MRILVVFLLLMTTAVAQPAPKQAEVDLIFSAFNTHTPGCAVGVAHRGEVVLEAGYGMADLERNVAITPGTVFESGSVAKQFTAAALLLLAQQGKISIDDPMRKYLTELPDFGGPVTIRQVMSHVSGLREWRPIATFGGVPEGTFVYRNQDLLQMAAKQRALNFDAGTDYSYSNTGYNISPILIERVLGGGKTFPQFTAEMIFRPLGMTHTRWRDDFRAVVPQRALAYGRGPGGAWTSQTPIENIIGAGGLLTTVGDLLRWNENFVHGTVGGTEFVKAQQTPATLRNGRTIAYAAGLMIATVDGLREVAHSGSTGGYRTWLGRYPDQAVSVAVLCNSAAAVPTVLGRETARLWTGASPSLAPASRVVDSASLSQLSGMYRKLRDNTVTKLRERDGKLIFGADLELIPVEAGRFATRAGSGLEFSGKRLKVTTANGEVLYERVEPVQPTPSELAALTGRYTSTETGTTLTLASGGPAGTLSYRIGEAAPIALLPTFRDAFETSSGFSVYFVRDTDGKVTALSVGDDRVWSLRFTRVR
jgi:CubicO group peptidase (beta-lactamase class C family)